MSLSKDDAERTFWQVPELIEYMLPFLDGESLLNLAKVHPLTTKVLKNKSKMRSKMWKGLVSQIHEPWWTEERDLQVLKDLLQLMGAPETLLLELLHMICEKYPSEEDEPYWWDRREEIVVSCPCNMSHHSVAPLGFRILESVEGAVRSTIQKVERVAIEHLTGQDWTGDDWLNALGARMKRQHEMVTEVNVNLLFCDDQNDAENAQALLMRSQKVELSKIWVTGDLGENGWTALAEALSTFPGLFLDQVEVDNRQYMLGARKEDLRRVWEKLHEEDGAWWLMFEWDNFADAVVRKEEVPGDENKWFNKWVGWEKFEEILVVTEEEYWLAMESEGEDQE